MSSRIRPALPADLGAICAISQSSPFAARWSRRQYEEEISQASSALSVFDDGEVQGYTVVLKVADEAQLLDLAVRPQDQGRGVGRALLEHAAASARGAGCSKLTLEVSSINERALALYLRAGFRIVGRRPKFYNDGSDAILMDLLLA